VRERDAMGHRAVRSVRTALIELPRSISQALFLTTIVKPNTASAVAIGAVECENPSASKAGRCWP
jgi:hypothetical protein